MQDAIATKVIDAIEQQVDVEAILNEVVAGVITDRPRLQKLVGPLAGAISGLIEREVGAFVASDTFAQGGQQQHRLVAVDHREQPDSEHDAEHREPARQHAGQEMSPWRS